MILTGPEIARLVGISKRHAKMLAGSPESLQGRVRPDDPFDPDRFVDIDPFDPTHCGPNSYDLTLAPELLIFAIGTRSWPLPDGTLYTAVEPLDSRADNPVVRRPIGPAGVVLDPGRLYLGSTVETTSCAGYAPMLETRSSLARLGVSCHLSAGFGDDGFSGRWTLEITVVHPVRLYAGVRIAQVAFFKVLGARAPYAGKYQFQGGVTPSRAHEDV